LAAVLAGEAAVGVGLGLLASSAASVLTRRLHAARRSAYPAAVGLWAAMAAVCVLGNLPHPSGAAAWCAAAASGLSLWPVASLVASTPALAIVSTALCATGVFGAGCAAYYGQMASAIDDIDSRAVRLTWHARRPLPLVRLQLMKLRRRPRFSASAAATAFVLALCWIAIEELPGPGQSGLVEFGFVIASAALAHIPLLARGTATRFQAPEVVLLGAPGRWASSVCVSALVAVMPLAAGFTLGIAVLGQPWQLISFGVGVMALGIALGLAAGFVLVVGADNTGGEALGLCAVAITVYAAVQALGVLTRSPVAVGALCLCGALALLPLGPMIEQRRTGQWLDTQTR
jgi:uncharacterized membrane protein YhaH (DUF805 family)